MDFLIDWLILFIWSNGIVLSIQTSDIYQK